MRLEAYLKLSGESQSAFARRAGFPRSTVSRLIREGGANTTTIEKVERATDGAVTARDLGRVAKRQRAA